MVCRFKFFRAVLVNGRQVKYVEEEVGVLLARWLPRLLSSTVTKDALQITINLIKFHSAYVDDPIISAYVRLDIPVLALMCCKNLWNCS